MVVCNLQLAILKRKLCFEPGNLEHLMLGKCQGTSTGLMAIKEWDNDVLSPMDLGGVPYFQTNPSGVCEKLQMAQLGNNGRKSKTEPPMFA
jgi:hypothetical protein